MKQPQMTVSLDLWRRLILFKLPSKNLGEKRQHTCRVGFEEHT